MATPEGKSRQSWPGSPGRPGRARAARVGADGPQATVLGTLTIPGRPEQVRSARAFVSRTLSEHQVSTDNDTATLLTSEIVTNAIAHTKSGVGGGTVTIVVIGIPHGVLVEVIDEGSAGTPVVKGDLYAAEGHGLFLVQHLAAQWGYLRNPAGTTVWFHLGGADEPQLDNGQTSPQAVPQTVPQAPPPRTLPQVLPPQAGPRGSRGPCPPDAPARGAPAHSATVFAFGTMRG